MGVLPAPRVTCEPLVAGHVPEVAALAAARIARLRVAVPALPGRWTGRSTLEPLLASLAERGNGRVALMGGRVAGILAGWPVRTGEPRVYAPEWAAGIDPALAPRQARRVLESLVESVGRDWVSAGLRSLFISVPADDVAMRDTLGWLGFGVAVVDAIAPRAPLAALQPIGGVAIRRAGRADLPAVLRLEAALRAHLVDAPTFLVIGEPSDEAGWAASLADPSFATLLAGAPGRPADAFLRIGPSADDVCQVIRDAGTCSISRAYTVPDRRGTGVAAALLSAAAAWAGEAGYTRVGVDFESANVLATRFWTAHFAPVVLTVQRRLHALSGTAAALDGSA